MMTNDGTLLLDDACHTDMAPAVRLALAVSFPWEHPQK